MEKINVDIEAGHAHPSDYRIFKIYGPGNKSGEVLNRELFENVRLGKVISDKLENSFFVKKTLFYDDTSLLGRNPDARDSGREHYASVGLSYTQAREVGYEADNIILETDIVSKAKQNIELILGVISKSQVYRLTENGKKILYKENGKKRSIDFHQTINNETYPSCDFLDLSVYQEKLKTSDIAITILPEGYEKQQDRVRRLFEILDKKPNVIVVLHNSEGKITKINSWNPEQTHEVENTLRPLMDFT